MDEKLRQLIEWIAKNAERESIALSPRPAWEVDAHLLLKEIGRIYGVSDAEISAITDKE